MNLLTNVIFVLAGLIAVYAIVVSVFTFRAVKTRQYEAYKEKQADFQRLDDAVKKAFEDTK